MSDGGAKSIVLALRDPHLLECAERNKIDPPVDTECFLSGGATTKIFIVGGDNAVGSFVILSKILCNMVVPFSSTTLAYDSLLMSTSHFGKKCRGFRWLVYR